MKKLFITWLLYLKINFGIFEGGTNKINNYYAGLPLECKEKK